MTHIGDRPTDEMYQSGYEIDCQCARCGGMIETEHCDQCDGGFDGHECGEDCCACAFPEPNCVCQSCDGTGLWRRCMNLPQYCEANPLPGRENMQRSTIEWFTTVAYDDIYGGNQ